MIGDTWILTISEELTFSPSLLHVDQNGIMSLNLCKNGAPQKSQVFWSASQDPGLRVATCQLLYLE